MNITTTQGDGSSPIGLGRRERSTSRHPRLTQRRGSAGMSIIDMVGALAILSILAAAMAPNVMKRIQESWRQDERRRMEQIGQAFTRVVTLHKTVPGTNLTSWASLVASELGVPEDLVWTNQAGTHRRLIYDPGLNIGGLAPGSLPFHQRAWGVTNVTNARLVILSALEAGYPNVALNTAAAFSNLWNRVEHRLPADWPTSWTQDPDNLFIQRVDLTALFHEVVLNNVDGYAAAPFSVLTNSLSGTGNSNVITVVGSPFATRLIHGTPLRLYYGTGQPQVVEIVAQDTSYAFEAGRWIRRPQSGVNGPTTCGQLGQWVEQFMNRADWGTTAIGTTPASVVLGMFDTLWGVADWGNAGFENENGHSKWEAPTARFLFDIAPQLVLSSEDLIGR